MGGHVVRPSALISTSSTIVRLLQDGLEFYNDSMTGFVEIQYVQVQNSLTYFIYSRMHV